MQSVDNLEIEAKFLIEDLAGIAERLEGMGAVVARPRVFERNVRFDTADDALAVRFALLRLREDAMVTMTYKGMPSDDFGDIDAGGLRVREELEVELSDFGTAQLILERIGFEVRQTYEKYRTAYQVGDVEVVLDELPYGDFIEIEGEPAAIAQVAHQLGVAWETQISTNYLGLLALYNRVYGTGIRDLTFDNFVGLTKFHPSDL